MVKVENIHAINGVDILKILIIIIDYFFLKEGEESRF